LITVAGIVETDAPSSGDESVLFKTRPEIVPVTGVGSSGFFVQLDTTNETKIISSVTLRIVLIVAPYSSGLEIAFFH